MSVRAPADGAHVRKLADESAYRSGLTAWFDYIASNHPHVLHHKVYVDEATGGIVGSRGRRVNRA